MRAYAEIRDDSNTQKVLFEMSTYLSFDPTALIQKTQRKGSLLAFQDLPMTCEYCGAKDDSVVYHHFYKRYYVKLVNDNENRIPLCHIHHTTSSEFSAHLTPKKFKEWIIENRGGEWYQSLIEKKRSK